jgi:hypothetical protein
VTTTRRNRQGRPSARKLALRQIDAGRGSLIRAVEIRGTTPTAAARALSRLAQEGVIQRVRSGVYHVPRETLLGRSHASESAVLEKVLAQRSRPTGITAANLLGFSTQLAARPELVVYASAPPRHLGGARLRLRPRARAAALPVRDAALLEFLRDRGRYGEGGSAEICQRAQAILLEEAEKTAVRSHRLRCLRDAALAEPPRVRAMLGALMQGAGLPGTLWRPLRESLNPLSRFDFGHFRELPNAREWQAR